MAKPVDFDTFALAKGVDPRGYCEPGMHNPMGFISKAAQSRHMKRLLARQAERAEKLKAVRDEYDKAVADGEIRPLTSLERLELAAAGHPDNASTQAARRALERRLARSQKAP